MTQLRAHTQPLISGLALACLLALSGGAAATDTKTNSDARLPKGISAGPCVEGLCEYRLPNGLRVLLFPDASKPTVTVNLVYGVGSMQENYGETGMAHLLEHLTTTAPPKDREVEAAKARARSAERYGRPVATG